MGMDFTGRVAIVTGAGGGLGRQHALALAARGAKVVVNDLGGAQSVVDDILAAGGEALANAASVTDFVAVQAMVQQAVDAWGRVDILINNAGILRDKSFAKMELADFQLVVDVHLMGSVNCTKAVWALMNEQKYGRIVMTTSSSGLYGNFGQSNYGAAKLALVGLMQTLSLEGAKNNIRVNALAPRNLALAADALGAKMVQFSTDDVFAKASHHPYNEFDAPAPESLYGKSKLAGEEFVRTLCHRYLIVRSAWVYGIGRDFVSTVLNAAADPTCPWLAVPTDRFASPTSADDLTAAVEQLIDHDTLGIYHIVCQGRCSRYDFAQAILKAAHMEDKLELHPIRAADAGSTPSYTVLDNLMLRLDNLPQPRPWKEALNEYINSLQ